MYSQIPFSTSEALKGEANRTVQLGGVHLTV
jgi:hypothetical protein